MCSDDELVILYLDINNNICNKHSHQQFSLIQNIEQIYESESDTDIGDFLNNITVLLLNHFNNIDLHELIRNEIYESELNYNLLFEIGATILTMIHQY